MFRGLHCERRRNSAKTAGFSPWSPVALTSPSQKRGGVKVTGRKGRPLEAQSLIEPANVPTDSAEEPKKSISDSRPTGIEGQWFAHRGPDLI